MRKVRTLRHWKQRFTPNAKFIWRRPITWQGEVVEAGDPIPKTLENNRAKLRRFWEAKVIELAEFEEPNVVTGQKPETPKAPVIKEPETLVGSDSLVPVLHINEEAVQLGEVVGLAFEASGLTVAEWNAQDDAVREEVLQNVVDMMTDLGEEVEDETPASEDEAKDETPAKPSIADKKPEELVTKETDRKWHVEGVEEVFKSKTKATAKAVELIAEAKAAESSEDDTWLDGDNQED